MSRPCSPPIYDPCIKGPIRLVSGDTRPQVVISIRTRAGNPVNLFGSTVRMYFRETGVPTLLGTVVGDLLTGYVEDDDSVNNTPPYLQLGNGGRVSFSWPVGLLDVPAGNYEGKVEVTFPDGTTQSAFGVIRFRVREDY